MQQHQRQQPGRLGFIGEERDHDPCQADRLGAQLTPDQRVARRRRVALVEDEVQDPQDPVEPLGQELGRRDAIGDPGIADLALGPNEPLREGRLRDEEGARDLGRRQPAQRAQRQGDPGVHRERRVAAREDESQSVIHDGHGVLRRPGIDGAQVRFEGRLARERLGLLGQPLPPAKPVDGAVAGRGGDPRSRVVRHAALRPRLERTDERVLDGLLGQIEVARHPDEGRDRPSLLLAEEAVDGIAGGVRLGQGRPGRFAPQLAAVAAAGSWTPAAA